MFCCAVLGRYLKVNPYDVSGVEQVAKSTDGLLIMFIFHGAKESSGRLRKIHLDCMHALRPRRFRSFRRF